MNIYRHEPKSGEKIKSLVIFLHGYGSNGADLIGLAPYFKEEFPGTLFISPDAPFPCELGVGYQWFSLKSWMPADMERGAAEAASYVNNLIDEQKAEYGLEDKQIALVGFSQGTMMSLYTAPRREAALAGVLGYSGALLGERDFAVADKNYHKIPVHLVHGDFDPVVPIAMYHHAMLGLKNAGFPVTGDIMNGLPHSIDDRGIRSGIKFLKTIL